MKSNQNFITIIIPVFNQSHHIRQCLDSIVPHFNDTAEKEILLVDDGSTDNSGEICRKYAEKYSGIRYFWQENKGVSAARNHGLRHATGKYIFFLDADDRLAPGTIERVAAFFDTVYEQTDLVTYPIETVCNGVKLEPHFRYRFLTQSGVYDLREYPYIGQTTMNIAVKNRFGDNLFFDEKQTYSEDQKYCCAILKDKLKMGFCREGVYLYYRNQSSASGKLAGACYIFEQCMDFFEGLFAEYEEVPAAFQGLYVNDIYWKLCSNILLPYHYEEPDYGQAVMRIKRLLMQCDAEVILNHPTFDFFEKFYLLRLRDQDSLRAVVNRSSFSLRNQQKPVLSETSMELVITKVRVSGGSIEVAGFLKTVFFQFYHGNPTLCVIENDGKITRKLELFPSAHNYYLSHEPTQRFWAMRYRCDVNEVQRFRFEVEVGNYWFPVHYYFMPLTPFSHQYKRYRYRKGNIRLEIGEHNEFWVYGGEKCRGQSKGAGSGRKVQCGQPPVWLYYDCGGVAFDNGLLQFEHDIMKNDGVERYYIISDERQAQSPAVRAHGVPFGSRRHRKLFLRAEKIITAYIEENNILPFAVSEYDKYAGEFRFETVYLQHGVLHIEMPWKYSPEKMMADRIVVSTKQEEKLFRENGFLEEELWKYKMPRFDFLKRTEGKKRKILFALSWRAYLVGGNTGNQWELLHEKFRASVYYRKVQEFLDSVCLDEALRENDYTMEVKLHPIFSGYREEFSVKSGRIRLVDGVEQESGYDFVVTDFSSILYDFLYLQIPVLSFIPDITEFRAGMNGYRKLACPDSYWQQVITEPDMLVERILDLIKGEEVPRMEADFFPGSDARECIYQALRGMR